MFDLDFLPPWVAERRRRRRQARLQVVAWATLLVSGVLWYAHTVRRLATATAFTSAREDTGRLTPAAHFAADVDIAGTLALVGRLMPPSTTLDALVFRRDGFSDSTRSGRVSGRRGSREGGGCVILRLRGHTPDTARMARLLSDMEASSDLCAVRLRSLRSLESADAAGKPRLHQDDTETERGPLDGSALTEFEIECRVAHSCGPAPSDPGRPDA